MTIYNLPKAAPVLHSVPIPGRTMEYIDLVKECIDPADPKNKKSPREKRSYKYEIIKQFAKSFHLGTPKYFDFNPSFNDNHILVYGDFHADLNYCKYPVKDSRHNFVSLTCLDHEVTFYHFVPLASKYKVAVATSKASLPYLPALEGHENEVIAEAEDLGWYCTFHHEWSWHFPERTGLILYQRKTPVRDTLRAWETSFKKYVIEQDQYLRHSSHLREYDTELVDYVLRDIMHDCLFPLDVQNAKDFFRHVEKLRHKFYDASGNFEEDLKSDEATKILDTLFRLWKVSENRD